MSKPCQGRDEALLMLAHGQIKGWQALIARSHAARCPHCRARLKRYGALSGALASALASPAGPRLLPVLSLRFVLTRGLFLGIILAGLIATFVTVQRYAFAGTPEPPVSGQPCQEVKEMPAANIEENCRATPTSEGGGATKKDKP